MESQYLLVHVSHLFLPFIFYTLKCVCVLCETLPDFISTTLLSILFHFYVSVLLETCRIRLLVFSELLHDRLFCWKRLKRTFPPFVSEMLAPERGV